MCCTAPCHPPILFPALISLPMVGLRHSSLAHLLDKGSPLPALFCALSRNWDPGVGDDDASNTFIHSLCAAIDLAVGAWDETGQEP